ncbi:hypothetical protein niasHT_036636 [Heterodera trifolii]|uniref:G-protein coupled receptors family 1 profile domain-containing protein n=1 Tax=Heterodera trifolii TaxID=157864 RepID=A0ABD2HZ15_9BILA
MNATNASSYSVSNPLYNKYVGVGFTFSLLWMYTPHFVIGLVGMVLNAGLVYVTWKCRATLRGLFNLLIAVESFASLCWEFSYVFPWFIALSGANVVSAELCFWLQFVSTWGVNVQSMTMLFVALERLCGIIFPIWSKIERNVKRYKIVLNLISFTYGLVNNSVVYIGILNEFQNKLVLCFLGDNRSTFAKQYVFCVNVSLEICTVCFYCLIWAQMARGAITKVKITSTSNMHILKSLTVIIVFVMFGWILNGLSIFYMPLLKLSPEDSISFAAGLVLLTQVASASNAPVLYVFSAEYRHCFRKAFPWLAKHQNAVSNVVFVGTSSSYLARRGGQHGQTVADQQQKQQQQQQRTLPIVSRTL